MAEIVGQNVGQAGAFQLRIPSAGEVFRPAYAPMGEFFFREGDTLRATNLEVLGQQVFTPSAQYPTYGHLPPPQRQALGQQVLQAQGIDYNNLPQQDYSIGDIETHFASQGKNQPLTDLTTLAKAVRSSTLVPKANFTLSGGTLEGLNNAQQKEFQDVLSGVSAGGVTFGRTPKGIVDLRTGQMVQSMQKPSGITSPESLGASIQISALEKKIERQLEDLQAGIGSGSEAVLEGLFKRFGVEEKQTALVDYNKLILDQQRQLREIPESIKITLQDVGISEAQYNRLVLKETRKPLETLRDLMELKGAAQDAIDQSLKFVSLFSDAALKDQAVRLELAKFEINTNVDLLKGAQAERRFVIGEELETERMLFREEKTDQRKLLELAIEEKKADIKRIQDNWDVARANGADAETLSSIAASGTGTEADARLAASGFSVKKEIKPTFKTEQVGSDVYQYEINPATGQMKAGTAKKIITGTPSGGATVSLAEAGKFNLPLSLVGYSEKQIAQDLDSVIPPQWFTARIEEQSQQTLFPEILQKMWNTFVVETKKKLTEQTQKGTGDLSLSDEENALVRQK